MNVKLEDIKIPDYPSGSYNFIRRLRHENPLQVQNGNSEDWKTCRTKNLLTTRVFQAQVKLKIAIIGAGVGGLATAIALKQDGHVVSIYEQASALSEIGAGIQIPPNSTRILHSWGLESALKRRSVKPSSILWRRWYDGKVISRARLNPEIEQRFGSPYYVTHRAHLHEVLYERTQELGVPVLLKQRAETYDPENGVVIFDNGETIKVDMIIAADGLKSKARQILNGSNYKGPKGHGLAAYRTTIQMNQILANPMTNWIAKSTDLNLWVGPDHHVMSYAISGGESYNMILTHPQSSTELQQLRSHEVLEEMRTHYQNWDPSLKSLIDMVDKTTEWSIQSIEIPNIWASKSGKMIILGDAAHAMVPYMALGAAMAIEDSYALAASLRYIQHSTGLSIAIENWVTVRKHRTKMVHEASFGHGLILHIDDGPVQKARDEAMKHDIDGNHTESPNQWSDPTITQWAYGYDSEIEIHRLWEDRSSQCDVKSTVPVLID